MKIIFLDIDGVLNTWGHKNATYLKCNSHIEPELIRNLEKIIEKTNSHIVISSSWHWEAKELLKENGFKYIDLIIDVTPREQRWRGEQIRQWLKNSSFIDNYVVIDDESFDICGEYCNAIPKDKVVQTDYKKGLTIKKVMEVVNKLTKKK